MSYIDQIASRRTAVVEEEEVEEVIMKQLRARSIAIAIGLYLYLAAETGQQPFNRLAARDIAR